MKSFKEKKLREFDREFVKDLGDKIEPVWNDPNGCVGPVRKFISETIDTTLNEVEKRIKQRVEEKGDRLIYQEDIQQIIKELKND